MKPKLKIKKMHDKCAAILSKIDQGTLDSVQSRIFSDDDQGC